ncbi:hypothetical protein ACWCPI_26980 [Streptomyces sp. NPDC001920]
MTSAARVPCLSPLLVLTAVPEASADGGWSVTPSGGGRPAFHAEGEPGAVLRDTVSVTNRGDEAVTVRLRGTGVTVALALTSVRVPARTRAEVPFTVTAPPAGSVPGGTRGAWRGVSGAAG